MSEQTNTQPNQSPIEAAIGESANDAGAAWDDVQEDASPVGETQEDSSDDSAWGAVTDDEVEDSEEDSEEDGDEEDAEEDSESEDEGDEEEEVETLDEIPAATKKYKAKTADGEVIEIEDNVVFKLKADGKFQEVTFKTLKDNYAGKVAWDEKFTELSEKKKAVDSQIDKLNEDTEIVNTYVKDVMTNMQNADIPAAINALADLTGQDRAGMIRSMLGGMVKFYNELAQLPEEQQQRYILQLENNAYKTRLQRQRELEEGKKRRSEVANKLSSLKEQWKVSDNELNSQWEVIKEAVKSGEIYNGDLSKVTPELIVTSVLDNRIIENINTAAVESKVELTPEDRRLIFNQLMAYVQSNGYESVTEFDLDDYVDFVKAAKSSAKVVKGQAAKNLSRKAKKNGKATPKTVKRNTTTKAPVSTGDAWDSL